MVLYCSAFVVQSCSKLSSGRYGKVKQIKLKIYEFCRIVETCNRKDSLCLRMRAHNRNFATLYRTGLKKMMSGDWTELFTAFSSAAFLLWPFSAEDWDEMSHAALCVLRDCWLDGNPFIVFILLLCTVVQGFKKWRYKYNIRVLDTNRNMEQVFLSDLGYKGGFGFERLKCHRLSASR